MDTVNISVPDTEKVINYSPNYYRRLNLILAKYTKRFVGLYESVAVFVYANVYKSLCLLDSLIMSVCLWVNECTACNETSCSLIIDIPLSE